MKVAMIGCHKQHNYGSMLQTLACQTAIQSLGNECNNLIYVKKYSTVEKLRQAPRLLNGGNQKMLAKRMATRKAAKAYPEIAAKRKDRDAVFERFSARTFTNLSRPYVGFADLCAGSADYDAVLVGSDQMWLPQGLPTNFCNLQFAAPGVRRISYSTSFGVSEIPWYQRSRTADYLRKIDFLSVREDAGARICREVAGVEAKVVVDPTLLFDRDGWAGMVPVERMHEGPYIFCYFLGTNPLCREEARALSASTGLPIVTLRHLDEIVPSDESFGDEAPYDVDPFEFVNLIRGAEYVLTDSFHGTVFSTIHHKPYATFYRFQQGDRQSRNSRIDSLFSHLGLEGRLVTEPGGATRALADLPDFDAVDQRLAAWRADSWAFLGEALV